MLHFEGERAFELPAETLWAKLRDAAFLAGAIPESHVEGEPSRDHAACVVRPGFAFVRGTLDLALEVIDAQEPASVRYRVRSKGVGSSSEVETIVQIAPAEHGSTARWSADVKQLGGLLKMVPQGLIRGAAQKVIDDVWGGIDAKLKEA